MLSNGNIYRALPQHRHIGLAVPFNLYGFLPAAVVDFKKGAYNS